MNLLNKISAAITGELLFRFVFVLETLIVTPILISELLQLLFAWMKFNKTVGKVLAVFLTASLSLLLLASCVFNPFEMLGIFLALALINHTIDYGLNGAFTGWDYGFKGVFIHCENRFNYVVSKLTGCLYQERDPATGLIARLAQFDFGGFQFNAEFRRHYPGFNFHLNLFDDLSLQILRHPGQPNPVDLNALVLSDAEFSLLQHNQNSPLNKEEIDKLKSDPDPEVKKRVADYENLWDRLEVTGECNIAMDRPAKEDAVLLVKLHRLDGQEVPVPNSSYIYDRANLLRWGNGRNTHPTTREVLVKPPGSTERYIIHPYYSSSESSSGISQELSEHARFLRAHLGPKVSERNREIAEARVRYFSSPAAPATEAIAAPSVNIS